MFNLRYILTHVDRVELMMVSHNTGEVECKVIISKVYKRDGPGIPVEVHGRLSMEGEKDDIEKAAELLNLFSEVPLDNIKQCLATTEGQICIQVFADVGICDSNMKNYTGLRMLVDELQSKLDAVQYNKDYVSREALMRELEDVLKAKSITPYRRQRINKALKRECLHCLGTGKKGKVINDTGSGTLFERRKVTVGVSTTDPECPTCKGSGIKPRNPEPEEKTIGLTPAEAENVNDGED